MGQIYALNYKNAKKVRTHKKAYCCTMLSPLVSLTFILLVKRTLDQYNVTSLIRNAGLGSDGVFPIQVVPCNLLHHGALEVVPELKEHYQLSPRGRLIKFGSADQSPTEVADLKSFFDSMPELFRYSVDHGVQFPRVEYVEASSIADMNLRLIRSIQSSEKAQLKGLPDASLYFETVDWERGIEANIQQTNSMVPKFIRANGYNMMRFRMDKNSSFATVRTHNEGFVSSMNLLTNTFLNKLLGDPTPLPMVVAIASPTADSSYILQLIENGFAALSIILIPISLSFGFPLVLINLVQDKLARVKAILEVSGLQSKNYWASYLIYYMLIMTISNLCFFLFAYAFVDIVLFVQVSFPMLLAFMSLSNLSIIAFAFFLSSFLGSLASAVFVGYMIAFFFMLVSSAYCMFVVPMPAPLNWYLLLLPQTSVIRFFHATYYSCLVDQCIASLFAANPEVYRCFLYCGLSIPLYLLAAFLLNEPKFRYCVFRHCRQAKKKQLIAEQTRLARRAESGSDRDQSAVDFEAAVKATGRLEREFFVVARDLNVVYTSNSGQFNHALKNFNFRVKENQIFGLLGPNGAGKSTFLSILTRSQYPTSGQCFLEGRELSTLDEYMIGYCPQFDILLDELTVRENHKFYALFKGVKQDIDAEVARTIESVQLTEKRDCRVHQLSGGMRRRLSLGISMIGGSRILLLDEPSSGLDPLQRKVFWETIRKVAVGRAVVVTTHLMEEAEELSDVIGIIVDGSLRCVDSAANLKTKHSPGTRLNLVWAGDAVDCPSTQEEFVARIGLLAGMVRRVNDWQRSSEFYVDCRGSEKGLSSLFSLLESERGRLISEWSITNRSLEDVFLKVVDKFSKPRASGMPRSAEPDLEDSLNSSELVSIKAQE